MNVEAALKPVFRRGLRDHPNAYRNKYLTFRAGYRYRTSLTEGNSSENRGILEITSRYRLPWQVVISDRNRGEFRFTKGQPFSTRFRNRLWLERDVKYGWLNFTPYVYDEIFYDTRYGRWTPNQYALGLEFPIGPHVVLEPYYLRQNRRPSDPPQVNAFGFKLNLYFWRIRIAGTTWNDNEPLIEACLGRLQYRGRTAYDRSMWSRESTGGHADRAEKPQAIALLPSWRGVLNRWLIQPAHSF